MCGICGIYARAGGQVDTIVLSKMMAVLRHRGPDGNGRFVGGEVGLGHTRLSIIDIGGGAQPMENENRSLKIVFNGEIYNFVELRKELESRGHVFASSSDTEVIVHGYEEWGRECVHKLNGMFAFALWDSNRRELFLARDHLGIKPLYYVELGNRTLFASEIKALLQDPDCPRDVDIEALAALFTFRYVPSPKTIFRGINKLPPGHAMVLSARGREIYRFWNWTPRLRTAYDETALIEEYQTLLEDAVRLQLRSDVPLGLFLSSGVDSGALLALMSNYSHKPVQTYTIGFEGGEKSNEVDDARSLADMFGATHRYMMITPRDYLKYYEHYLWDIEEPVGNETAAAFYFVSKVARKDVKVALSGQGADEPWAGYDRYVGVMLSKYYSRLPTTVTAQIAALVAQLPGRFERLKRGVVALGERDVLTRFTRVYSFFSTEMKRCLFRGELRDWCEEHDVRGAIEKLQGDVQHLDPITQMLYIDTRANLPDDLLMVADKTSMANSLEARVPYLDYRLIEFVESLPPSLKLNGFTGKYLHKKALEKWLPKRVVHRKKKGFANPIETWFRTAMSSFVEECLLSPKAPVSLYFDQEYIRRMIDMDRRGTEQYRRHIYLLVSFALWHRTFISN